MHEWRELLIALPHCRPLRFIPSPNPVPLEMSPDQSCIFFIYNDLMQISCWSNTVCAIFFGFVFFFLGSTKEFSSYWTLPFHTSNSTLKALCLCGCG